MVSGLGDAEDQSHGGGAVIVGSVDVSITVSLEEVLIASGGVGHALTAVGFVAEVSGWCTTEPVGFVAAPAICEGWDMAFGLQVDAEKRITIGIERRIADGITGSGLVLLIS